MPSNDGRERSAVLLAAAAAAAAVAADGVDDDDAAGAQLPHLTIRRRIHCRWERSHVGTDVHVGYSLPRRKTRDAENGRAVVETEAVQAEAGGRFSTGEIHLL